MQITQRGATTLWDLIIRAESVKHFAILFLEANIEGGTKDARATRYWKSVAVFLREWADTLDEYAKSIEDTKKNKYGPVVLGA